MQRPRGRRKKGRGNESSEIEEEAVEAAFVVVEADAVAVEADVVVVVSGEEVVTETEMDTQEKDLDLDPGEEVEISEIGSAEKENGSIVAAVIEDPGLGLEIEEINTRKNLPQEEGKLPEAPEMRRPLSIQTIDLTEEGRVKDLKREDPVIELYLLFQPLAEIEMLIDDHLPHHRAAADIGIGRIHLR